MSKHEPRPGIRHAAMCPHRDKTTNLPCGTRELVLSVEEQAHAVRLVGVIEALRRMTGSRGAAA